MTGIYMDIMLGISSGSQQIEGQNYWETYSLVIASPYVCLALTMVLAEDWHIENFDSVLPYTQVMTQNINVYGDPP